MDARLRLTLLCLAFVLAGCSFSPDRKASRVPPTSLPSASPEPAVTRQAEPPEPSSLLGSHDGAEKRLNQSACRAYGWLIDLNDPEHDVKVKVFADGIEVAQAVADLYRPDLELEEICPEGTCAFAVDLWDLIAPNEEHTIQVQAFDLTHNRWVVIDGSPRVVMCTQAGVERQDRSEPQVVIDPSGRVRFQYGSNSLILEFLDDDLVHFELASAEQDVDLSKPIYTSPMVYKTDYPGPSSLETDGMGVFETPDLKVQVDPDTLCLTVTDKTYQPDLVLTTLCPRNLGSFGQGISLTPESFSHAYGLGQEFITPGSSDGDWIGRVRSPGEVNGNDMIPWNGGSVANTQFPIVYFAGQNLDSYALFIDNPYRQRWDFTRSPWNVEIGGEWLRFYLFSGPDLQDLRKDYLELVGHPPVPPKKMFGLWISEYGFDQWAELESKLSSLRENLFPVDGFVLDLQWFGGIQRDSDDTRMGSLSWDLGQFPDPASRIAALDESQGVGIMVIEESYIGRNLPEYADLESRGYLALDCETCPASYLTSNTWWGKGGMVDWSNPAGRDYWHDLKRGPLIEAGVIGHWTDLGEPEIYDPASWYWGILGDYRPLHAHADVHNLLNLMWSRSIFEGYQRNGHLQRPFILSRSGAPGSQRYGVSMWSGDIGSNLSSLATHLNVQMHMSMSGIDYFGSDIGGFHRDALDGDLNEMYTQWFANGMAFDIPGRAHTENLCNCNETAPDRLGDLQSNLENVRLRYTLSPYLYSLAHRAYWFAEPVIPPLVYYYQNDPAVREMGHEKMLGRDLLVAIVAGYGETERDVYLPAGTWVNYHTNEIYQSSGEWFASIPTSLDGKFKLPLFARGGAIIPQMYVDEKTLNITGMRSDGSTRDELIVSVFLGVSASSFILYEDDGETTTYQDGEVRQTLLSQGLTDLGVRVSIGAASGAYAGAPESRGNVVRLVLENAAQITQVTLNGSSLPEFGSRAEWESAPRGWYRAGENLVIAKSGQQPVAEQKVFEFTG